MKKGQRKRQAIMGKKSCATASNYHLQFTYQRLPIFSFLTRMNLQLNRHCKNTPLAWPKHWNCWKWMNFNEHNGQYVLLEPSDDRHLLSSGGEYIRLFCSKDQFNSRLRRKSSTIPTLRPLPPRGGINQNIGSKPESHS